MTLYIWQIPDRFKLDFQLESFNQFVTWNEKLCKIFTSKMVQTFIMNCPICIPRNRVLWKWVNCSLEINSLFCCLSSCMLWWGGACDCCCCWWWCNKPTEWCCPDCEVSPCDPIIPWWFMCWMCTDGCNSILIMTYKSSAKHTRTQKYDGLKLKVNTFYSAVK